MQLVYRVKLWNSKTDKWPLWFCCIYRSLCKIRILRHLCLHCKIWMWKTSGFNKTVQHAYSPRYNSFTAWINSWSRNFLFGDQNWLFRSCDLTMWTFSYGIFLNQQRKNHPHVQKLSHIFVNRSWKISTKFANKSANLWMSFFLYIVTYITLNYILYESIKNT